MNLTNLTLEEVEKFSSNGKPLRYIEFHVNIVGGPGKESAYIHIGHDHYVLTHEQLCELTQFLVEGLPNGTA